MSKQKIVLKKITEDIFEVRVGAICGLAKKQDDFSWELSPNVRSYADAVQQKISITLVEEQQT